MGMTTKLRKLLIATQVLQVSLGVGMVAVDNGCNKSTTAGENCAANLICMKDAGGHKEECTETNSGTINTCKCKW